MLAKFLTRLRQPAAVATAAEPCPDPAQLALLFRHFPIGARLTFFFEQAREVQFCTLVVGYRLNDHDLVRQSGIRCDQDELPCAFRIDKRTRVPLEAITSLRLVLPDTSSQLALLDPATRAALGSADPWRGGATLTLRGRPAGRSVPIIESRVDRRETATSGLFAGQAITLIEPDLEMIRVVDSRRRSRVRAALDATLYDGVTSTPCRLVDFSEETLRLHDTTQPMPVFGNGAGVEVEFTLGAEGARYRVRGKVMRQSEHGLVVRFTGLCPPHQGWRAATVVDALQIKSALLNAHP